MGWEFQLVNQPNSLLYIHNMNKITSLFQSDIFYVDDLYVYFFYLYVCVNMWHSIYVYRGLKMVWNAYCYFKHVYYWDIPFKLHCHSTGAFCYNPDLIISKTMKEQLIISTTKEQIDLQKLVFYYYLLVPKVLR